MREAEEKISGAAERKERIRTRYQGVGSDEIDVIPAIPQAGLHEGTVEKRVAVYARVSTDDPRQTSSYELQKNHYQDVIRRHPGWKLVEIYADEGISGTSLQHRDAFLNMIADCHAHKIDLILTKSVSRFARNVLDCIGYVRQLAALTPPVGVLFETENIYTLDSNSEMSLSIISTMAQEESHNKSESMNASIEMRFRRGIFLTPPLLGYDHDADGNLVINEEEAKTVRLIFYMYLYGYSCAQIAGALTQLERRTKKGNCVWSAGAVLQILQNERHCGDVLARKTWTPSYLDHKSRKNRQNRNQYRRRGNHAAIISRDDFIAVQRLISNAKYGNKGILPELQVIPEGALKGFVLIHPRWAGFKADDYRRASASVYMEDGPRPNEEIAVNAQAGDFDLRGYEIARAQFFDTLQKCCATFSSNAFYFSTECVRKFHQVFYVELLVHPTDHLLAVRPSVKENRRAVHWAKSVHGLTYPRGMGGAAFLPNLFALLEWNPACKYRVRGIRRAKENESVILFDMHETEIFIPSASTETGDGAAQGSLETRLSGNDVLPASSSKKSVLAYPADWVRGFGSGFYVQTQARKLSLFGLQDTWAVQCEGMTYRDGPELNITGTEELYRRIREIIDDIRRRREDGCGDAD